MIGKKLFLINSRYPFTNPGGYPFSLPFESDQIESLYKAFLLDTVHRFSALRNISVRIIAQNEDEQKFLSELLPESDIQWYESATTGDVIADAIEEGFQQGAKQVFILDSFVPTVPIRIIQSGLSLLEVFDDAFAIAPIERGGFYAVGMNSMHANVLRGVDTTTVEGYEHVISNICEYDASVYILNSWYDVRQVEDVVQLRGEIVNNSSESNGNEQTKAALELLSLEQFIEQDEEASDS